MSIAKTVVPEEGRLPEILAGLPEGRPIIMVNLLRFKERALYPDGKSECSGREAYRRYGQVAAETVARVGGRPIWIGAVRGTLIGPEAEEWDAVMLVEYPSVRAFVEMLAMPDYQEAAVHRTAALADSRLIASERTDRVA